MFHIPLYYLLSGCLSKCIYGGFFRKAILIQAAERYTKCGRDMMADCWHNGGSNP